ncbi:MAG: MOSC domain-containing protein, partial [Shimia sp.]
LHPHPSVQGLPDVGCATSGTRCRLRLSHPDLPDLIFDPATEGAAFVDWTRPLIPDGRPQPARLVRATQALTDSPFPSVSILGLSSLRALSQRVGRDLDPRRFRGNVWLDGTAPWQEFEWIGRTLRLGPAELTVRERITRCRATEANPETGRRDADTLGALEAGWGHTDFGVYAEVTAPGTIAPGDTAVLL